MRRQQSLKASRVTAYHEAGHAVAAIVHRIPFDKVTIVSTDEYLGGVFAQDPSWFRPDLNNADFRTRSFLERRVIGILAGPEAERRHTGRRGRVGAQGDYKNAVDLASYITGSFAETEAYLRWLTIRAEGFVAYGLSWHSITMLAEALLERETVSSRAVRLIIRRAWESWDIPVPAYRWPTPWSVAREGKAAR